MLQLEPSARSPWLKQDIIELTKVQHCAAQFVCNNHWPMVSVTEMLSFLACETLEKHCQKARTSVYVVQGHCNGLVEITMYHLQPFTSTSTRSFHGQNLLLPSCRIDIYICTFIFSTTVSHWNILSREVIESGSLQSFKQLL